MAVKFANRMNLLKGSEIRALLALTAKPEVISFAGGMPAPELFPTDIFYHGNTILFCSEFNKPDLERGYLIAFNKCRMINIYHKIMVNITNIIPDVNENENRRLKYLFLVGTMEK